MFDFNRMSKWVAECFVIEAIARGIPAVIYRPGTISGHSKTGASNRDAFINRLLCGLVQMKRYPLVPGGIEMVPVDFVAKSIVLISMQKEMLGHCYNIVNPTLFKDVDVASPSTDNLGDLKAPAWITNIMEHFRSFGYDMEQMESLNDWKAKLFEGLKASGSSSSNLDNAEATNELYPVCSFFNGSSFPTMTCEVNCKNLRDGIRDLLDVSEATIDRDLIHAYLRFYVERGIIPPPPKATQ